MTMRETDQETKMRADRIRDYLRAKPNWEYRTRQYVLSIGREYVHLLNIWNGRPQTSRQTIYDFYDDLFGIE